MAGDALLRIGELSRRTGLSADVIRAWERRYDLLEPQRTEGNFRLYGVDDISRLRLMQHYLAKGIPAAQAAGLVHQVQTDAHDTNPGIPAGDVRKALRVLRESLERFDDARADRVLQRLLGVFAPGAVLRDVVMPYLRGLGERWECGEATIAQEHFASSFLEGWMLSMARGWGQAGRRRVMLACLPGERHVLGLVGFGLAMRDLGWRITYLGADMPLPAVEQAADAVRPDVIVLAAALPTTFTAAIDDVQRLAARHPIAVGGAGSIAAALPWLSDRTLPRDPLVAAHALSAHSEKRSVDERRHAAPAADALSAGG